MPARTVKPTPDHDLESRSFDFADKTFFVKRKYKIGKFLKTLNDSPVDAIEIVLEEQSYNEFLELEMDMDDLKEFLEKMSGALAGSSLGN